MRLNFNSILKYFLCLAAALSFAGASAAPHACLRTNVFYVNGVWNFSPVDAYLSAVELRRALTQEGVADAGSFRIRTIWNPGSLVGDVAEVLVSQGELKPGFVLGAALLNANLDLFVRAGLSAVEVLARQSSVEAINNIKSTLRAAIENEKAPALVVAHSQGNIFVNKAVNQLTTEVGSKDVPGIGNIAVLGLAVAAGVDSVALMLPTRYEYLTAQGDLIIDVMLRSVANVPAANFSEVQWNMAVDDQKPWYRSESILSTRHVIGDTYLSNTRGINENGALTTFSAEVARKFVKLRNGIESAWPCITDVFLPTVKQFTDAEVAVRIQGRPGDVRVPQGTVQFTYGGGVPFFGGGCNAAPIGSDGYARCIPSFRMAPGTYSVQVSVFPRVDGVFTWTTDLANDGIGTFTVTDQDGPEYSFEFRDAGATIPPQCQQYYASNYASPVSWSFLVSDFQQCTKGMKPQIRCVGVGCTLNRFFVTTTSVEIITTYQSVFSDSGSCPNPVSTQVHAGPTTYPGFNWGPVGSFDTINPYGSDFGYNETFNVYYLRNITNVVFYQPPYQGPYGTLCAATGHSVEFRVRIFDNLEKRYFSESFAVGTQ